VKTLRPIPPLWPERERGRVAHRAFGLLGMVLGAALPPVAVSGAPLPVDRSVDRSQRDFCCSDPNLMLLGDWMPFVERRAQGEAKTCLPTGEFGADRSLIEAPQPEGYAPQAIEPDRHHACLLVAPDGHVEAVRLSGRIEAPRAAMIRTIRGWRFRPAEAPPAWVRVRLSARYVTLIPPQDGRL
jgi:hypothetical protein